jgi:membrane protein DedA with SNARE-associated domain
MVVSSVVLRPAHDKWLLGVIIVAAVGAVCGDNMAYLVGRKASVPLTKRREKGKKSKLDWAATTRKRGGVLILTARSFPEGAPRDGDVGRARQRWPRFFLFTVIAGFLWATYAALLGYFGATFPGQSHRGFLPRVRVGPVGVVCHRTRSVDLASPPSVQRARYRVTAMNLSTAAASSSPLSS